MKAIVTQDKQAVVKDVETPKPAKGQILVKVAVVGQNPTDWKHVSGAEDGLTVGCDFAGVVEALGEGVSSPAKGTRVAGFVHGTKYPGVGSFAEYVKTEAGLVWVIPDSTSFEDAAAIGGIAMETAVHALFLKLALSSPFSSSKKPETVLVWAGSTAVGQYAIQLAHAAGHKVVATASPKNFDLIKSYGADSAFDYRDPETPKKIKEAHPGIKYGLDGNSGGDSPKLASSAMAQGGRLILLVPSKVEITPGVQDVHILVYTTRGKEFSYGSKKFPVSDEDRKALEDWLKEFPQLLKEGKIKASRVRPYQGLDKVTEGFEYMKSGKLSAEKIVYHL